MALIAGKDLVTNPVFGVVFKLVWVGLVPVSLLGGALWRGVHPVRTFAGWFKLADRRILIDTLGVYPAALGILVWGWFELIQPDRATSRCSSSRAAHGHPARGGRRRRHPAHLPDHDGGCATAVHRRRTRARSHRGSRQGGRPAPARGDAPSSIALLSVMVVYTVGGLVLLFSP